MTDSTETARRELTTEINAEQADRAAMESQHGQVWTTDELRAEFAVVGFAAPFVIVTRKSDGARGTMEFQHMPRIYFNWLAD